jgi:GTP-binding protein
MSSHIIAIVGRPSVGKSTLFNRILGYRDAIVHDVPGVTRDRHYGEIEWAGKTFTLIDTGGYLPQPSNVIQQAIREQATVAIEEAHAIVFLVDAAEGINPFDEEIAGILRKTNKKVYLVVNKVDSEKRDVDVAQFYRLGLGDPVAVSAYAGRKVGDFLDLVTHDIPKSEKEERDPRLKIAIIGKPNVGKSSFVNVLVGAERSIVTEIPGTTRDPVDSVIRFHGEEILLVDTAGLRRRSRISESVEFFSTLRTIKSIERCDVAVILVDAEQGMDKQDLRIVEQVAERKRPMLLAVNKWDVVEKDEKTALQFERNIRSMLRRYDYVPVIFISAKLKQRVVKVIEQAKDIFANARSRVPTKKLNDILLKKIKDKPPASSSGKEIKIKYITQVRVDPPSFTFFVNEPKLINETYRRFLENEIRRHFQFTGIPLTLHFKKKFR